MPIVLATAQLVGIALGVGVALQVGPVGLAWPLVGLFGGAWAALEGIALARPDALVLRPDAVRIASRACGITGGLLAAAYGAWAAHAPPAWLGDASPVGGVLAAGLLGAGAAWIAGLIAVDIVRHRVVVPNASERPGGRSR